MYEWQYQHKCFNVSKCGSGFYCTLTVHISGTIPTQWRLALLTVKLIVPTVADMCQNWLHQLYQYLSKIILPTVPICVKTDGRGKTKLCQAHQNEWVSDRACICNCTDSEINGRLGIPASTIPTEQRKCNQKWLPVRWIFCYATVPSVPTVRLIDGLRDGRRNPSPAGDSIVETV